MARGALTTVLSVGLSAGVVVFSFFGCFTDPGLETGACDLGDAGSADAGPGDCTIPKCNADGTPAPVPVPNAEKKVCFRGENEGVCVDGDCALICETQMVPCKCATETACPDDKQCIDWACVAGACISTAIKEGELLDPLGTGDCQKSVCQGGKPTSVNDDADIAEDTDADCLKPACVNGVPMELPDDMDTSADTPKDCQKPACVNGMSMPAPDVGDVPDAMECVEFTCNANTGSADPKNASKGKKCATGQCDGNGVCKLEDGQACTNAAECVNGNCADGVCCNAACTDECKSCAVPGKVGMCTNIPYYQEDMMYTPPGGQSQACNIAIAGSVCDGMGKCLRIVGTGCTMGPQCISGTCTALKCVGATGEICTIPTDCESSMCAMGTCK
jgi:hypothetical protein